MAILPYLVTASLAASPLPPAYPAQPYAQVLQAPARPALWVVNDNDTIIYLFGTFHALDGRTNWFDQSVRTAFAASDQLMLETLVPKPVGTAAGQLSPVQPGQASAPVAQLAPSSFLGTTKMVASAGRAKGLSTDHGADAILRDAADRLGKPVAGLESFESQLRMFSSLPAPANSPPAQDPKVAQALGAVLSQLQIAWSRGDIDAFAPMLRHMQVQSPETYNTMFVERNARWAEWIAERMKTPGTIMVAVGAGHLSGPDSVQNKLALLGVKSARIN
jgi:uncharacterized protein YbaP (TraB family)